MIGIKSNIALVSARVIQKMQLLADTKELLRPVAVDVLNLMTERIHEEGRAADDKQIGTYSPEYMKVRTGNFRNAKVSKKTGKRTNAGYFTKGQNATFDIKTKKANSPRPRYNRTGDTKIIVSLTRQLENDWAVIGTTKGYGIGFNNPYNLQKMRWVEARKKKKIAALTPGERAVAIEKLKKISNEKMRG